MSQWHKIGVNYCLVLFYDQRIIHDTATPGQHQATEQRGDFGQIMAVTGPVSRQLATILNFLSHKIWCHKLLWPSVAGVSAAEENMKHQYQYLDNASNLEIREGDTAEHDTTRHKTEQELCNKVQNHFNALAVSWWSDYWNKYWNIRVSWIINWGCHS